MTPEGMDQLKSDEGIRLFVYNDETGKPITYNDITGIATIGYGRNLVDRGITEKEADYLFNNDIISIWDEIIHLLPWMLTVNPVRQDVVIMIEYNTGKVFEFRKMLAAIKNQNWQEAAGQLVDSKAARQLPLRYNRMADALFKGSWP